MKNTYSILHFTLILILFTFCSLLFLSADENENSTKSQTEIITVNPNVKFQTLEGWGGSLCWWANVMGGYSDEKIDTICDWITNPITGLNMNIFRFNIGGGDAPSHNHMRTDGGAMQGYKDSKNASYNWKRDENQRKILQELIVYRIKNTGKNDVQIVGFSNSPPWWMTVSGCVSGSEDGISTNLKPDMFDDFADYLTEVTRYYHDSLGITFNTLEPFNEPFSTWWKANKKKGQEGCRFSQKDQEKMIRELYKKLSEKNMLDYCAISVMDANTIDEAYKGLQDYKKAGDILSKIKRIDTHSYGGTLRKELCDFAKENDKNLWQSESGPLDVGGSNEYQMITVAQRIITDLREMQCAAWIDWQLANDRSPLWGMIIGKYNQSSNPIIKGPLFYLRAQFSRYLKSGFMIVKSSTENSIAGISQDKKELVLIIVNQKNDSKLYKIDLSKFQPVKCVKQVKTSVSPSFLENTSSTSFDIENNVFDCKLSPQSVTTFILSVN